MSDHLPESFSLASILAEQGVHHLERLLSQNDWLKTTQSHHHETGDCEPHGRAVLLGSFTLLLSGWEPFPSKISCFVGTCVSLDNSFPSVRQEPNFRPWKGSTFLQQVQWLGFCTFTDEGGA